MAGASEVAPEVVERVRAMCLALPEVHEEPAWIGVRWRIRTRTFAHLLVVGDGGHDAFAQAAGLVGGDPVTIVTFRAEGEELDAIRHAPLPFFYAGWGRDAVGLVLDDATDWDDLAELLTESYCVLAPKKLVALVDRPEPDADAQD